MGLLAVSISLKSITPRQRGRAAKAGRSGVDKRRTLPRPTRPSNINGATDFERIGLSVDTQIGRRALDFSVPQEHSDGVQIAGTIQDVKRLRPSQRFKLPYFGGIRGPPRQARISIAGSFAGRSSEDCPRHHSRENIICGAFCQTQRSISQAPLRFARIRHTRTMTLSFARNFNNRSNVRLEAERLDSEI